MRTPYGTSMDVPSNRRPRIIKATALGQVRHVAVHWLFSRCSFSYIRRQVPWILSLRR
ncbi:hypothetical protein BDY21DRAFT_354559 [Lineolata rhizophorae]|uniref:Uncharacterized protein n=1 Tax=Lineolata rhizophorae TaxID=578093 RepID=A0A6A6NQC7_9PEZI|nr:hypothetical protein BDY21DRAFT_354559 [Lineolata rhizophorae]